MIATEKLDAIAAEVAASRTTMPEGEVHVAARDEDGGVRLLVYPTRGGEQIKVRLGKIAALELSGSLTRVVARILVDG